MPDLNEAKFTTENALVNMQKVDLKPLNVLIGENGSGKTNFLDFISRRNECPIFHFDHPYFAGPGGLSYAKDNKYLRADGANVGAFLYRLKRSHPEHYNQIRKTVHLGLPFFNDFVFKNYDTKGEKEQIYLFWKGKDKDYPMDDNRLSQGSLRFICLVTALLMPQSGNTLIFDEPELGLSRDSMAILGALLGSASTHVQVIIATQSPTLMDEFSIDDLILVERKKGVSNFERLKESDFKSWLEDYTISELWQKNVLQTGN